MVVDKQKAKKEKTEFEYKLVDLELYSLKVSRGSNRDESKPLQIKRTNNLELVNLTDKKLTISVKEKVYFDSEGPFEINLDYRGVFEISEPVDKDFIEEKMEEISYPVLASAVHTLSFVMEKIIGHPLIFPPKINKDNK
ncbi:hypothetical protein [Anoxybacillus ayderensis]|uniref:hypothetical protein n=1 Tax=Anoxybacillus ayderensis TaxID=265546 RepID=UPI002E21B7DE|nr:hypothetical protein [Anoxybacillus ayderensis]